MKSAHFAVSLLLYKCRCSTNIVAAELTLSGLEYAALEDRFKRLECQHSELQDLASAYSEVIRGFCPAGGQTVSIDQLQVEAGRDGLRAKALEADILRPLVKEAGGLQAMISRNHTMNSLIDKAGGLRELEKFVSDLRTIRDTLDELGASQGLGGLASEVRDLLVSRQQHAALESRVNGPNGLGVNTARYEALVQAFNDIQNKTFAQRHSPRAPTVDKTFTRLRPISDAETCIGGQPAGSSHSVAGPPAMNPARARLISATPLETDPDRDLYEGPQSVAKPHNKTGSNITPLGTPQVQPTAQLINHAVSSNMKRKGARNIAPRTPAKRPRVHFGRATASVQSSLTTAMRKPLGRASSHLNSTDMPAAAAGLKSLTQTSPAGRKGTVVGDAVSGLRTQAAVASQKMPDWMRTDFQFERVGNPPAFGTGNPMYSSSPPGKARGEAGSSLARFATVDPGRLSPSRAMIPVKGASEQTATEITITLPDPFIHKQVKYPAVFWVGHPDTTMDWDVVDFACRLDLKKSPEIPRVLRDSLLEEFSKHIPFSKCFGFYTMTPKSQKCILR